MSYVYLKNKNNGTTYVYESVGHWDKEKQMCVCDRTCIGKLDAVTGELIYSKKYLQLNEQSVKKKNRGPVVTMESKRSFYGATYLFDRIGDSLGVTDDLKRCFPDTYQQILSIAYYLILEDRNPLSRFSKWAAIHKHPYGKDIPSQRSSELFASITEDAKDKFFQLQGKRRCEDEFWAYDTTSISSYSHSLKQVKYGVNKDHDPLRQINIAMLFGEKSNLPFYYRKLAGNIPDVKTVKNLLADMDFLGYKKIKLVMDRGFYSESNINELYKNHLKFLIATKVSLKFVKNELDQVRNTIRTWKNYNAKYGLYVHTVMINWAYTQDRPYKGDTIEAERRMYLHIYFNSEKALEHEITFNSMLSLFQEELITGKRVGDHEKQYQKYFDMTSTPVRGIKILPKQEAIEAAQRYHGYFALLSNEIKDPIKAIEIYRNKDVVEKAFGNLKERLNLRKTAVSSDSSLDGKLFVQFVALIYLSYIKKKMSDKDLYKNYTMQEIFDEFDIIECFEQPGCELRVGEVVKRQNQLYDALEIQSPSLI